VAVRTHARGRAGPGNRHGWERLSGFTTALEAARDQLTAAAGIFPDMTGLPGAIGRAVLSTLLPGRRPRFSARKVKCATSRYLNHGDQRPHATTAISVTVRTPPPRTRTSTRRPHRRTSVFGPRRPTRRELITAIITSKPPRDWTPRELARMLNVHPRHLATELREWSLLGIFTRTGLGIYRLNMPAPPPSSTSEPDP